MQQKSLINLIKGMTGWLVNNERTQTNICLGSFPKSSK